MCQSPYWNSLRLSQLFTAQEITFVKTSSPSGKSPDLDGYIYLVYYQFVDTLTPILENIFNAIIPTCLSLAQSHPHHCNTQKVTKTLRQLQDLYY